MHPPIFAIIIMSHPSMRLLLVAAAIVVFANASPGQADSARSAMTDTSSAKAPPRAKRPWAYANYQEYLDNKPSIKSGFKIIPYAVEDGNPLGVASIEFDDSIRHKPRIWGFSDGNLVYILPPGNVFSKQVYVPLEYAGRNSFYTLGINQSHQILVGTSLQSMAISGQLSNTMSKTHYYLMVINDKGKSKEATIDLLLKIFKANPDVYQAYLNETLDDKIKKMRDYLVRFNDSFVK